MEGGASSYTGRKGWEAFRGARVWEEESLVKEAGGGSAACRDAVGLTAA